MSKTISNDIPLTELLEEEARRHAAKDCIFFIERYLKTFDPRPEAYPHDLDFFLYDFQKEYVTGLIEAIRGGYDLFDEKSRDMGASWLALAVRFWMWRYEDGYQSLLGSRKEEYVDSGDAKSLFWKLDYFIRTIKDPLILPKGFDPKKHRTYMKLVNPENGNAITGESSNKNFSRGGRYKDVLFDEFGFWPDARQSWTAAGDATHCRHAVTTPPDEPSYSKELRFSQRIKVRTFHWTLHPHKDSAWYSYQKTRRTQEEVLHEIDISWEYSNTGRPYPEIKDVPVGQYGFDKRQPLYVSMDLGLDALALGYYQPVENSDWTTMVDAFQSSDKIIEWYFPFLGLYDCVNIPNCPFCHKEHVADYTDDQLDFMKQIKSWQPTIFFGDPSGKQRHIESGVSPYWILEQHGIEVHVNDAENDWVSRRDATKRLLPKLRVNDTPRTSYWLECFKNARYPKRDLDTSQSVTPISKPVHDWTSHHRTQTEFFAVNFKGENYENLNRGFVGPVPIRQEAPKTPWKGQGDGTIEGTGLDVGKLLNSAHNSSRDWRNS